MPCDPVRGPRRESVALEQTVEFRLFRYFSIPSAVVLFSIPNAIVLLAVTAFLAVIYRDIAIQRLIEQGQEANVAATTALSKALWPELESHLVAARDMSADELRAYPQTARLREAIQAHSRGLSIVKIKIYETDGRTVFSTDPKQIGEDKSGNASFLSARAGVPASELTHRDTFSAFEQTIEDRDLLSSYVLVDNGRDGVRGVFEVFDDVTPLLAKIDDTQVYVVLLTGGPLSLLFVALLFIVRHADRIIARQHQEIVESHDKCRNLEEFAFLASHDLQEPLRMVASYCDLLQRRYKGRLDADADEFIGFAVDGARRMQALINGLLTYSRVGMKGKELRPTDCHAALETAVKNLGSAIDESGSVVAYNGLPTVMGDFGQITQLFQNLLANSIKFRREAPPQIDISAAKNGTQWTFSVSDNGIGLEPQYADHIFVIFERLHSDREYPGTGIGLAVCKRIVERHAGRIWVESKPGAGSTFYFTLPAAGSRA